MTTEIEIAEQDAQALIKIDTECGLETAAAQQLRRQFEANYISIRDHCQAALAVTDGDNEEHRARARTIRLALKADRCEVERRRKELKEDSLRRGKAIDGYANVLKYLVQPVEDRLEGIEKAAEIKERLRKEELAAVRQEQLNALGATLASYNLGEMDDATWSAVLETETRRRDDRVRESNRIEVERIERARLEAEERERQRLENIRLKAEAEAREAERKAEREAAAKKQAEIEAKAKAEREAAAKKQAEIEAKAKAEKDAADLLLRGAREAKEKAERELAAKEKAERDAKAAAEAKARAEAKAKADAEAQAAKEAAKAKRKAARAPDCEKLRHFAECFDRDNPASAWPAMKTSEGQQVMGQFGRKFCALRDWLITEANRLEQEAE